MLEQPLYAVTDPQEVRSIIRSVGWATLVSAPPGADPVASHLPVVLDPSEDAGTGVAVLGHLAKRDAEHHRLGRCPAMVIVEGPSTYVSPSYYPPGTWVPTWDFVLTHLHGYAEPLPDTETLGVLTRTIEHFERLNGTDWHLDSSQEYAASLLTQVTAFRLRATKVVAKAKLSQDKSPAVRAALVRSLRQTGRDRDEQVAALIPLAAPGEGG